MMPLILAGGALAAAMYYKKKTSVTNPPLTTKTTAYKPAQPSLLYPWRATNPPRVDNSNQPWYVGPRNFTATPPDNLLTNIATSAQAGSSVIHSVGDIWGNLNDFFGGGNGGTVDSADNVQSTGPSVPAADANQGYDVQQATLSDPESSDYVLGVDYSLPGADQNG